jgi:hypothetical protein
MDDASINISQERNLENLFFFRFGFSENHNAYTGRKNNYWDRFQMGGVNSDCACEKKIYALPDKDMYGL